MGLLTVQLPTSSGKLSQLQNQYPTGHASKSIQSEIEQLLSTRNIVSSGLGGEQLVFPLLVPAPALPSTPPDNTLERETWQEADTQKDEVVLNDEYLCSEQVEEPPSLELVLGEEPSLSFPDMDSELINLLSENNELIPDEDWDRMTELHPSSTDDGTSSAGSLNDERLPEWDPDDFLPPASKKPSIAGTPPLQLPTTSQQIHPTPSYYLPSAPTAVQQQQPHPLPASSDIMVKLSVPGQPNMSVTLERDKLLDMPADRFNHLLDRSGLSENDMAYMKEWRRKGKNKMAAQIARKRKREEVDEMAAEVDTLKEELAMLKEEQRSLQVELEHYPRECRRLERTILTNYRDHHDNSVTPDTHQIVLLSDTVLIAPVVQ